MSSEINLIIGIGLLVYGIYYWIMREVAPEKLGKLQTMQNEMGDEKARKFHIFGYTIVPFIAGAVILMTYFRG